MYSTLQLAFKYLRYYLTSSNGKGHGIHSPFIFHFITKVLNDKKEYPAYAKAEELRARMLKDNSELEIDDPGAGSSFNNSGKRTISSIARNTTKSPKYAKLLFRMARQYQPKDILELGTSLGITTTHLAAASPEATVLTIEGSKAVATIARKNFNEAKLNNIKLLEGNFDTILPSLLQNLDGVDFCFIDGDHRLEPTLNYFHQLLPKMNNESVIVFDDIHWSREMENAWVRIRDHSSVRCTVDLFFIGIVFFRKEFYDKQHFAIRF